MEKDVMNSVLAADLVNERYRNKRFGCDGRKRRAMLKEAQMRLLVGGE